MSTTPLVSLPEGLDITSVSETTEELLVRVTSNRSCSLCPLCSTPSSAIHSYYRRWSYPLAAFVVGWLCERSFKHKFLLTLGALLAGSLILTLFAVASSVFITHAELPDALQDALSYSPGDFLLLVLVAGILQLRKR